MSVFQMPDTMIYLPAERQGEPLQRESFAGSSGYGLREKRTARTGPSRTLQSDTPKLVLSRRVKDTDRFQCQSLLDGNSCRETVGFTFAHSNRSVVGDRCFDTGEGQIIFVG